MALSKKNEAREKEKDGKNNEGSSDCRIFENCPIQVQAQ
jgi:hypothetical protein